MEVQQETPPPAGSLAVENSVHVVTVTEPEVALDQVPVPNTETTPQKKGGVGRPLTADRKRPYPCNLCPSRFGSKMELEEHQNSHTGQKPFECEVCKARFNRRSTLWNHKRIHSDAKPFQCPVCEMTFKWKNSLKCHKEMHLRKNESGGLDSEQVVTYATAAKRKQGIDSQTPLVTSKKRKNANNGSSAKNVVSQVKMEAGADGHNEQKPPVCLLHQHQNNNHTQNNQLHRPIVQQPKPSSTLTIQQVIPVPSSNQTSVLQTTGAAAHHVTIDPPPDPGPLPHIARSIQLQDMKTEQMVAPTQTLAATPSYLPTYLSSTSSSGIGFRLLGPIPFDQQPSRQPSFTTGHMSSLLEQPTFLLPQGTLAGSGTPVLSNAAPIITYQQSQQLIDQLPPQSEQNLVSQQMGDYLPNYEYNMPVTVQPVYQEQQVNNNQQQHLNANVVDSSQSYTIAKVVPYEQW